jgi:opacity protein-like surface antigen
MKRLVLCTLSATLLGAAVLAPSAVAATTGTAGRTAYVVGVTGTIKGGFVETWSDSSVVYVPTIGKQHHDCANSATDMSYCLGLADGRMYEELALKISLAHTP